MSTLDCKGIDDSEVGEIWRLAYTKNAAFTGWWRNRAVGLIRKLVEERALRYYERSSDRRAWDDAKQSNTLRALSDFSIDLKEWSNG
jgi:hypothetical protein